MKRVNDIKQKLIAQVKEARKRLSFDRAMIDFETSCDLVLKDVGAFVYSRHPSCKILMMSYNLTGKKGDTKLWNFYDKPPKALLKFIKRKKTTLNAFNSYFEYCIWQHVGTKLGWPKLPGVHAFLDVQDKAAAMALPTKLEDLCNAVHAQDLKDKEGTRLIKKFCEPRKDGSYNGPLAVENESDWKKFQFYCIRDTDAQLEQDNKLPDLTPIEQVTAWMTNEMNLEGLHCDLVAAEAAAYLREELKTVYNGIASKLAKGAFEKCTQRAKVKQWLEDQGHPMENMQGDTVTMALREKLPKKIRTMLECYQIAGSTSGAKFDRMIEKTDPETGRIHELLAYHIARTGRKGGRGIQIQNLPRPTLPKGTDFDEVIAVIKKRDVAKLIKYAKKLKVTPMQVLTSSIRAMITPFIGNHFKSADYAAIEARCLLWEAMDDEHLDIFRRGEDIYLDMASEIYNVPLKKLNKESDERPLGKETILGCGYGMGASKFRDRVDSQAGIKITAPFSKEVVYKYRNKFEKVPILWSFLQESAIQAVLCDKMGVPLPNLLNKKCYRHLKGMNITYHIEVHGGNKYLVCVLPSTKKLYYLEPKVGQGRYGYELSYAGKVGESSEQTFGAWGRVHTYGGKLTENVTQAIARDLMMFGMLMVRAAGYNLIMTVHDEVVTEDDEDFGSLEDMEMLLCTLPRWAKTPIELPVESEGWEGHRYRK